MLRTLAQLSTGILTILAASPVLILADLDGVPARGFGCRRKRAWR